MGFLPTPPKIPWNVVLLCRRWWRRNPWPCVVVISWRIIPGLVSGLSTCLVRPLTNYFLTGGPSSKWGLILRHKMEKWLRRPKNQCFFWNTFSNGPKSGLMNGIPRYISSGFFWVGTRPQFPEIHLKKFDLFGVLHTSYNTSL